MTGTIAGPSVRIGTVGGEPVTVDPLAADFTTTAFVVIGSSPYFRGPLPPGWPTQPAASPTLPPSVTGDGAATEIAAGATVLLFTTEAAALVAGGFATYA